MNLGPALSRFPALGRSGVPGLSYSLGAWVGEVEWNLDALDAFSAQVGKMPKHVLVYQHWGAADGYAWNTDMLDALEARGVQAMLTWSPWNWAGEMPQVDYALSTTISGAHDARIDAWATAAAAYAKPLYIRFAHEMNGYWYPWCRGVNGNTAAQYIAAWRHVVNHFRAAGATNVCWIWAPNVIAGQDSNPTQFPFVDMYPGDAYVDMIGFSAYNYGDLNVGDTWRSIGDILSVSYAQAHALAPTKPIYIAEMACSPTTGDKAAWIADTFLTDIPTLFPDLVGAMWFNEDKECDWTVDSSPASLAAYQAVAARDPGTYLPHHTQALSAPAAYATTLLTMSPAGYWRLGEASGTVADNAEGTAARDGAYVDTPTLGATGLLTDDSNKAVTLNGSSERITVADAAIWDCFEGTNPWTIAFWLSHTPSEAAQYLFYKRSANWGSFIGLISYSGGFVVTRVTAAHTDTVSVAQIGTGGHFVVATYDGTTMKAYVDGGGPLPAIAGNPAASQSVPALSGELSLGGTEWGGYTAGTFDEIAVWNRAITAAEVSSLMDAGTV